MIEKLSSASEAISTSATTDESPRSRPELGLIEFHSGVAVNKSGAQPGRSRYKLVERSPWELDPHLVLAKHHPVTSATRLSAIAKSWDPLNLDPICITRDNKILKGLEECEFARMKNIEKVSCLEYDLDEEGQIRWILEHHRKPEYFNDFVRIVVALELKPLLRERARRHMQIGGQSKGSMNLPEVERIDCREKIADAADVADVQVSKVEELLQRGNLELLKALRNGEVRIHRASVWLKNPEHLSDQLLRHRTVSGITKKVNTFLQKHRSKPRAPDRPLDIRRLGNALAGMDSGRLADVVVAPIRASGQVLLISEQLLQNLETQGELNL
jgi:hypothetical protein